MGGHGGGDGEETGERHAGYGWLFFCAAGMMGSLTLYGVCMEYVTSGGRKVHEFSFLFVTTAIYAAIGFVMRSVFNEKPTDISKYNMLVLSCSSIASTFTSVRSLRYVIYPVQILFKSCKPVPVMAFGVAMGKQYPIRKYVNVAIITCGVALFMGGGSGSSSSGKHSETTFTPEQTLIGAVMLSVSLCFDGATGAYEDKLMSVSNVEPFDLMYNIQLGKAVLSFCMLTITNGLGEFISTISNGGIMLVMLGLSGALGQVFVFLTISKFGALNCALIGLFRKILSLLLSFVLYGHTLNGFQAVGITLALCSMIANFYEKGGGKKKKATEPEETPGEGVPLLSETDEEAAGSAANGGGSGGDENAKGLEYDIEMVKPKDPPVDFINDTSTPATGTPVKATSAGADVYDSLPEPPSPYFVR